MDKVFYFSRKPSPGNLENHYGKMSRKEELSFFHFNEIKLR
jgi:hypothetical protein